MEWHTIVELPAVALAASVTPGVVSLLAGLAAVAWCVVALVLAVRLSVLSSRVRMYRAQLDCVRRLHQERLRSNGKTTHLRTSDGACSGQPDFASKPQPAAYLRHPAAALGDNSVSYRSSSAGRELTVHATPRAHGYGALEEPLDRDVAGVLHLLYQIRVRRKHHRG